MNHIHTLAVAGGLLSIFVLIHFVADWVFQSHATAMAKSTNAEVRAKHCAWYTVSFWPVLWYLTGPWQFVLSNFILFFSHFYEDTYYPVFLWAKHIRKPAVNSQFDVAWKHPLYNIEDFKRWVQTPLGIILMIAIDQIIHIVFLFIVVEIILC